MLRIVRRALVRYRHDARGIAATEFALILPLMVLLYAGVVDLTRAAVESRKVRSVSRTIGDLVSRQPTQKQLSPSTIASILTSASAIMTPYPAASLTMTLSVINLTPRTDGTCCTATVLWSYTQGGPLRPCLVPLTQGPSDAPPSPTTIPAAIVQSTVLGPYATAGIVIADVHDAHQPIFKQLIAMLSGGMDSTTYVIPRGVGQLNVTQPFTAATAAQQAVSCL